jgi:hypothetical protein
LVSNQTLVDGRDITLITLDESLSESGSGTIPVDTRPVSVSETTVPIRSSSEGPVSITLPTTLPESRWRSLLPEGNDTFVESVAYESDSPYNRVTIRFEEGETYRLRMAKIGVARDAAAVPTTYLTAAPGPTGSVAEGASRRVSVEVRDRYNNPVANESVNLMLLANGDESGVGTLSTEDRTGATVSVTTDERGRASATYRAPTAIDGDPLPVTIGANRTAAIDPADTLDTDSPNTVRFGFNVTNADGSPDPYEIAWDWSVLANQTGVTCGETGCTYDPNNEASVESPEFAVRTSPTTLKVPVSVTSNNGSVATLTTDTDMAPVEPDQPASNRHRRSRRQ